MDIAGYNKEKIEELADVINNTYQSVTEKIGEKLQQELVVPMSTKWYAPEAVDEFEEIQAAVEEMGENMEEAYQAYADWIEDMGEAWAENTGGSSPGLSNISEREINIDIGSIQEENAGNITLDESGAMAVANRMESLHQELLSLVRAEHDKLNAASAFIGHGQGAAAQACFNKVANSISELFKLLTSISERLKKYAEKYKEIGETVRDQLNSAEITVE